MEEHYCEECWHYIGNCMCDDGTEHEPNEKACDCWEDRSES